MIMANEYSTYKIGQIAWFLVSVYHAVVLTDLVKDGLFIAAMTPHGHRRTLFIIIPTLTLYLVTVIEAYGWLAASQGKGLRPGDEP
jgi:hypothetical protein